MMIRFLSTVDMSRYQGTSKLESYSLCRMDLLTHQKQSLSSHLRLACDYNYSVFAAYFV